LQPKAPRPVPGSHRELRPGGERVLVDELAEAADPVPAYLRQAAVGIAIVHEEIGVVRARHPNHAVRANPKPTVADGRDEVASEWALAMQVLEHHEVVSGPVVLPQSDVRHSTAPSSARSLGASPCRSTARR